ncbi:MAG: S8 family serine peptidase [Bacteroidota bacterium]
MLKKIILSLVWIGGFAGMVSAQTTTNTRILKQAAVGYKLSFDANYAKAMALAKKNNWDLSITTRGGKAVLVGVDDFGFPKYIVANSNVIAAATTRASQLWPGGSSGLNLNGSSAYLKNKIGIWDGGAVLGSHVELNGRITQKDNPSSTEDHATHVAGTMIASGVNPSAKGMAFGATGMIAYDFTGDVPEMISESSNLLISNHSYGFLAGWNFNSSQNRWEFYGAPADNEDYKFGYYSDESAALDSIAYNAPFYLIVKSAGNNRAENGPAVGSPYFRLNASGQMISSGNRPAGISNNDSYDIISDNCGAKNILTVGAVNGIASGYSRKEDVVMSSFSSWGPTDDGRIKPDVVADGVNVLSSIATTTTSYATFSGTSMATPNAAGSLFLLQEHYSKLKNSTTAFLRSATLKGLAIHTADEAGIAPGPDYKFGWGLLNVQKAAAVISASVASNNGTSSNHLMYENTLTQGQTFTTSVVASGKGPLQATICWTDVKGIVEKTSTLLLNNRAKKLVNDLDIRITKGGATPRTYFPWTLDVNLPDASAVPGDNITDNVERIDIDSTVPGQTYTITVTHKGTLARGSQAYSLLISGAGGTAVCTSTSGGGGARIDSVGFKAIQFANTAGSKNYTDNTKLIADVEASQTIPIRVRVSTADASTNQRIVKVFIDYNNNGVFDVATETAVTSGVLSSAAQTFVGSVVTPSSLTVGNLCLMRVIVQETSTASDITPCGTYGKGETQDYIVRVTPPSNDMLINGIVSPAAGDCSNTAQYLTVSIRNNGSNSQSNIPLTATVMNGATTVANMAFTYPGPIAPLTTVSYTFQAPFATTASTTYTVSASANLATDQSPANNSLSTIVTTADKPAAITAIGGICGTTVNLRVNSPDNSNYFWYMTPSGTSPFAVGPSTTTTTITTDKTYYVAKEAKVGIGPANKTVLSSTGGYNNGVNYMKFNNSVPINIETARLYVGNAGKVQVTVADLLSESSTSFSYRPLSTITLDVYPTTPTPLAGFISGNNPADTGAVFLLNLPVASVGDHILMAQCLNSSNLDDSSTNANLFRNNGITGTTYPISVPNIVTFTGNGAGATQNQFYYFFYDMKVNTGACIGDRLPVVATNAVVPAITQQADSLVSSVATGNQWYLNDTAINGANLNHFKPTKAGVYKVITTNVFGCQQVSNTINFVITATIDVTAREINLQVSPNPNNGVFNLSFEVTSKADLSIDLISASGQRVYNSSYPGFSGKFSKQLRIDNVSSEFYLLKIQHNKKTYVQKILIQR